MDNIINLNSIFQDNEVEFFQEFIFSLRQNSPCRLYRDDILFKFQNFLKKYRELSEPTESFHLGSFFSKTQELILQEDYTVFLNRPEIGKYHFYSFENGNNFINCLTAQQYLKENEKFSGVFYSPLEKNLVINFEPFNSAEPMIPDFRTIGFGQKLLSVYITDKLQREKERWRRYFLEFLRSNNVSGHSSMVNGDIILNQECLFVSLHKAIHHLGRLPSEAPIRQEEGLLKSLGFGDGFGSTLGRAFETMKLLSNLIKDPNPEILDEFLSRVPIISKVAIISPHGWFGQKNVLGRPDTGGQVVYILDQVRSLEKYLTKTLRLAGLKTLPKIVVLTRLIPENDATASDQRLEKIHGTVNGWILRVPFRDKDSRLIPHWISRFEIWPYLEDFAIEGKNQLLVELEGNPDLIVGNYSDGNLVASLISSWLGSTQCNIAHALEKVKYPNSDLNWEKLEDDYHFSLQYTADLIAMNMADMIITSTVQEICGTKNTVGQYESYRTFSMPKLFAVDKGINLFDPKFNVVSPGSDETVFFSHKLENNRLKCRNKELNELLFKNKSNDILGELVDTDKPPIFTMARLDKIKNISGLVESFGLNADLRKIANLIVVAGTLHLDKVKNKEEKDEIHRMHELIEFHNLRGNMRWLGMHFSKTDSGEVYRIMADRKGVFVQPAFFEAFGLTIVEAMISGLPVFATQFGGPLEIVEDGVSGFLVNPEDIKLLTEPILRFMRQAKSDPKAWEAISEHGVHRAKERYSWRLYAEKIIKCANLYRFWNYSARAENKKKNKEYCNLLFHRIYKKRVREMENLS